MSDLCASQRDVGGGGEQSRRRWRCCSHGGEQYSSSFYFRAARRGAAAAVVCSFARASGRASADRTAACIVHAIIRHTCTRGGIRIVVIKDTRSKMELWVYIYVLCSRGVLWSRLTPKELIGNWNRGIGPPRGICFGFDSVKSVVNSGATIEVWTKDGLRVVWDVLEYRDTSSLMLKINISSITQFLRI